jgi:hypothetical protein
MFAPAVGLGEPSGHIGDPSLFHQGFDPQPALIICFGTARGIEAVGSEP